MQTTGGTHDNGGTSHHGARHLVRRHSHQGPAAADGDAPKITIRARGAEHSANIRDNAHKGSRLMVKGGAGDEGSGIDIEATSLAFDPSHDEPDGKR